MRGLRPENFPADLLGPRREMIKRAAAGFPLSGAYAGGALKIGKDCPNERNTGYHIRAVGQR